MKTSDSIFKLLLAASVLTAVSATRAETAAPNAPQIEIESTFVEVPEAVWKKMAGTGTWRVIRGQSTWTRLLVSAERKDQQALVGAWFGDRAAGHGGTFLPLVRRALSQEKGADVLSAPRVITRSHQRAKIEIVRQFRYPAAWKPGAKKEDPWVPVAFATKNTGVTLAAEPTVVRGGKVSLWVAPRVLEFEGFKDIGHGRKQPVFSERKVQTRIMLESGQTVILGGAVREDQQIIEDSFPVLGGLPLLGPLFRSSQKQTVKRCLVVLVTPRILPEK